MATFKQPEELNIRAEDKPTEWQKFKQRFDVFATATGLDSKSDEVQAATFLHIIGADAHEVSNTFQFDSEEEKDMATLKAKFEEYCLPKKNITLERHRLLTRKQGDGEPFRQVPH